MTEQLINVGKNGELWVSDTDYTKVEKGKINAVMEKLYKYETDEKDGRMVVLPCDTVYFICDKGTKYAHVRSKSILDLLVYEIARIDKNGRYWSDKKEAQKALKDMEEKLINEFAIEWTKDWDYAGVTVPSGTALKSKLMRYAESRPDEVKLMAENKDGSAYFHVPISYIKVSPPRKVSEEQREAAGERFRKMWEEKKGVNYDE